MNGTDFDTGLLSRDPSSFLPKRSVGTEIAFLGEFCLVVPNWSRDRMWARFTAFPASNAAFCIDGPHIPVIGVNHHRTFGTGLHTFWLDTLSTLGNNRIIRKVCQVIVCDLNPRQGEADTTLMDQGTCHHTTQTTLAFLGIRKEIPLRYRYRHSMASQKLQSSRVCSCETNSSSQVLECYSPCERRPGVWVFFFSAYGQTTTT